MSSANQGVEEVVRRRIEKIVDPVTGLSLAATHSITRIKEVDKGVVYIDFLPSSPYSPLAYSFAIAIKNVAQSVQGVKKVVVQCHNHVMANRINEEVNR